MVFSGVGVALVALFDDEEGLDIDATATHAKRLVDLGIRAVLVNGTTGEVSKLTSKERDALLLAVVERLAGSAIVIAGVDAGSTDEAVALSESASDAGAACVLSPNPMHYASLAELLPVLAYHWPARYPPGIDLAQLDGLPVAGLKDSTGDPKRLLDEVTQSSLPVYVGSSSLLLFASGVGAIGAIVGSANAFPELSVAAFDGDGDAQRELHMQQAASAGFPLPHGIKQLTSERFGTSAVVRS